MRPASAGGSLAETLPALVEHLTATAWGPNEPRQTSTVMLFTEVGVWKACLHDRENGLTLWRSAETLGELLEVLDSSLRNGGGDWRPDKRVPRK